MQMAAGPRWRAVVASRMSSQLPIVMLHAGHFEAGPAEDGAI